MILTTRKTKIIDKRGRLLPINQCLIDKMITPRGGWSASFIVRKLKTVVSGSSAQQVFANSKKLLKDNGVDIDDNNLWFSLNFQWADRVADRDLLVPREMLENATTSEAENETPREYHHPSTWGSVEWNAMANYLNVDPASYSYSEFLARVETTLKLLNPVHASRIGCIDCFREFSRFVGNLRMNPLHNLMDARQWLFDTHNTINKRIGKPVLTYAEAKQLNRW